MSRDVVMTSEIVRPFNLTRPSRWPASGAMSTMVIATRHEIAGAGIEALLQAIGHRVVARYSSEDDLLRSLEAYRPDIVVLAENMIRQEGTATVLRLRARNSSVRIIFLIEERDAITTTDLLKLRVEGIVLSTACAKSLAECVASVHQGRLWIDPELVHRLAKTERPDVGTLTQREADVAYRVSQGLNNKEIARELQLSKGTVKMHLHHIYEKLGLSGRTQLALTMAEARARMPLSDDEARPLGNAACQRQRKKV
jgi:two-component system nitrate/nitrite response regulator NarL